MQDELLNHPVTKQHVMHHLCKYLHEYGSKMAACIGSADVRLEGGKDIYLSRM